MLGMPARLNLGPPAEDHQHHAHVARAQDMRIWPPKALYIGFGSAAWKQHANEWAPRYRAGVHGPAEECVRKYAARLQEQGMDKLRVGRGSYPGGHSCLTVHLDPRAMGRS